MSKQITNIFPEFMNDSNENSLKIPRRFIRIWIGGSIDIPKQFEDWWEEFQTMHPGFEFLTITKYDQISVPDSIWPVIDKVKNSGTCAGISDIYRILALYDVGGIYVDTDVMPLKPFNSLLSDNKPFLAKRSGKSFESAIMGSPKRHPAFAELIKRLPKWFNENQNKSASVQTGPAFVSSVLFGRLDIRHLPIKTFYPYNGFGAPKRQEKERIFNDKNSFPEEMIAAHFSNRKWGGKP